MELRNEPSAAKPKDVSGAALFPIMSVVFIGFLVIGIAIPVLPLHVHQGLGQSTFLVGLVVGSQFASAILSRVWAGRHSDTHGPKGAVIVGLSIAVVAGVLYLISLRLVATSVVILLMGRALLGVGESYIICPNIHMGVRLGSKSCIEKTAKFVSEKVRNSLAHQV